MEAWGSEWGTACRKPRHREAEWFLFHVHYASAEPVVPQVTELRVKGERKPGELNWFSGWVPWNAP